jgi:hypothetical protein
METATLKPTAKEMPLPRMDLLHRNIKEAEGGSKMMMSWILIIGEAIV